MWWDESRIERTVTRKFVCSHLLPEEIARLDRPLGFGDGLTDGTYWEWIDEKAKKIFLILVDLGVPDQIFGVIDDSWDDEDLPIAYEHVERLALTPSRDERMDRKFYTRQFYYLLRPLEKAGHAIYMDMEVVPVDTVDRRPGGGSSSSSLKSSKGSITSVTSVTSSNNHSDRVVLPNYPGCVFTRRKIPLAPSEGSGYGSGYFTLADFQAEVNSIRNLQNDHLVSYFASYVHRGYGYVLFTPPSDGSIKSLLATTPSSIKNLAKKDRRQLVFNWILCLVDTLCFMHSNNLSHGNIKPSTVLFNNDNHIFYSDLARLGSEMSGSATDKASFDKESYDYAAPEQWYRPPGSGSRKNTLNGDSSRAGSTYGYATGGSVAGLSVSPESMNGFSYNSTSSSFSINRGTPAAALSAPNPQLNPQAADVFSLGCVVLELLSFMMKRQTRSFATHRAAKHKTPGRGGAVLDSSFHKNLGQVESWMTGLARDAASKKKDDSTLTGVAPMLHVVERMLSLHASERPSAYDVQARMYQILRDNCGIAEPHCVHQYNGWDYYSISSLKLTANYSTGTAGASTGAGYVTSPGAMSPTAMPNGSSMTGSPSTDYFMQSGGSYVDSTVMSISGSKRSSSGHISRHGRSDSRAESRAGSSTSGGTGRSVRGSRSSGGSTPIDGGNITHTTTGAANGNGNGTGAGAGLDLTDGLQAIRNLQIRDKVRQPWNAPVYAA